MVSPEDKRAAVAHVRQAHGASERRACGLAGQARSTQRYQAKAKPEDSLPKRITELAAERPRFGYRRLTALLKREGVSVWHGRVHRITKELRLQVPRGTWIIRRHSCRSWPSIRLRRGAQVVRAEESGTRLHRTRKGHAKRARRIVQRHWFTSLRQARNIIESGDTGEGHNFHGQQRSNDTHASRTDRDAKLYRKGHGQEAKLSYLGHVLMENRNGLIVDAMVTHADGTAERDAALLMIHRRWKRHQPIRSLGADKAYDTRDFVKMLREMQVLPHIMQNVNRARGSAVDTRTTRHASYQISQQKRPWIERAFGWMKAVGGIRKVKLRGLWKVEWLFLLTAAAFNLWRIPKLKAAEV
jgi:hypothetical protein